MALFPSPPVTSKRGYRDYTGAAGQKGGSWKSSTRLVRQGTSSWFAVVINREVMVGCKGNYWF